MARDIYHSTVREALIADGWTVTHDPLPLSFGGHNMYVDMGAERMMAAERGNHRIAVEVKSFVTSKAFRYLKLVDRKVMYRSVDVRIVLLHVQ